MVEYIEREAAKMAVVEALGKGHSPFNAIVMLPAADVVLVRHGRWILRSDEYQNPDNAVSGNMEYECSECGHGDVHHTSVDVKYCWFCGARMDGDGE